MTSHDTTMSVECRTCPVRELQCGDCMVPVLLDLTAAVARAGHHGLDPDERAAVTRLVAAGLLDAEAAARARAVVATEAVHAGARDDAGRAVG